MRAIMMMGLPLSGKTTFIKENQLDEFYRMVSADEIRLSHPDYDPKNPTDEVHQWAVKMAEEEMSRLASEGIDLIMDAGSINNNYTVRIIEDLKSKGYSIRLIHIRTPVEVCLERNEKRERKVPVDNLIEKSKKEIPQFNRLKELVDTTELHFNSLT